MDSPGKREKRNAVRPEALAQGDTGDRVVRVLAAVIRRGEHWLVCRRPAHKRHGGLWEFPGGKLHPGESLLDAARRELMEELGVEVLAAGAVRFAIRDAGSDFVIEFVDVEIHGEPEALEHEDLRWADALELSALSLAPGDDEFVKRHLLR
jgi:mutator protein MutT